MGSVVQSEGLSRKEKEYLARRRHLLDSALKIFSVKGYAGASIQEIAQASEFSIGTLYNFFETKESLYLTIVEEKFIDATRRMEFEAKSETDCVGKIRKVVCELLVFTEENREFFNIFLGMRTVTEPDVHGGVHEKILNYHREMVRFFQGIIEEGISAKIFRNFTSRELAYSLIGICNATVHDWLTGPENKSLTARHERILDLFFNGSLLEKV